MEKLLTPNGYVPHFEGAISDCRKIHDHFVIFNREGIISGARTNDLRLKEGASFYKFIKASEVTRITDLCNSFDLRWLIIDTDLGCAAVCTALYGVCRLLFAVIFISPKECVRTYFASAPYASIYVSPEVQGTQFPKPDTAKPSYVEESFQKAERALSCNGITEAKYGLGIKLGKFLAEHVLSIADFVGCVGKCNSFLDFIPRLDNFTSEIFVTVSLCAALFARNESRSRSFKAKIAEYKEHLLISFCIDVDEDFRLYANRRLYHKLLLECENAAIMRDAYFDCSLLDGDRPRLVLSCVPESDPMTGRRIKQDLRSHMPSFWEE